MCQRPVPTLLYVTAVLGSECGQDGAVAAPAPADNQPCHTSTSSWAEWSPFSPTSFGVG